jgi:RNA polymerase sigma-70 factor (ECF subfamily)
VFNIMKLGTSFTTSAGVAPGTPTEYRFVTANSGPAIQVVANDRPFVHFQISVRSDDRVGQIFLVVNPEKLNGVMSREPWVPRP